MGGTLSRPRRFAIGKIAGFSMPEFDANRAAEAGSSEGSGMDASVIWTWPRRQVISIFALAYQQPIMVVCGIKFMPGTI